MRVPLPFEKESISVSEMLENINWYLSKCDEAYSYLEEDKRTAMEILKSINSYLEKEHHHYNLAKVSKKVFGTENELLFIEYESAISNAFVKQNRKTSYSALSSNLYDVQDYLSDFKYRMEAKLNK
ncbi:hypothetical protein NHG32_06960 [Aerococcaceae bacterium NML191219]|nr:hypothetical protein [Aerococcaceae bacterium NML191219]